MSYMFCPFAHLGEWRAVKYGPFQIRATLEHDPCSQPDTFDALWERGDWQYCGVVLSVWLDEVCLDVHAVSLWGVEVNYPGSDNSYLAECAREMLPEAITRADELRREIVARLS